MRGLKTTLIPLTRYIKLVKRIFKNMLRDGPLSWFL